MRSLICYLIRMSDNHNEEIIHMLKSIGIITGSIVSGMLMLSSAAFASCSQGDVQGTWQIYTINSTGDTTSCKMTMNSGGRITSSKCTYWSGGSQMGATTASGTMSLQSSAECEFGGTINVGGLSHRIRQLTLANDKATANGFGTYPRGQFLISLSRL